MDNFLQTIDEEYLLVNFNALAEVAFLAEDILNEKDARELSYEIGQMMYTTLNYDSYDIVEFLVK